MFKIELHVIPYSGFPQIVFEIEFHVISYSGF